MVAGCEFGQRFGKRCGGESNHICENNYSSRDNTNVNVKVLVVLVVVSTYRKKMTAAVVSSLL